MTSLPPRLRFLIAAVILLLLFVVTLLWTYNGQPTFAKDLSHAIGAKVIGSDNSVTATSTLITSSTQASSAPSDLVKPAHTPIVGLVFFGRRDRVEILNCYLQRNLVTNGGWLDEIQWVRNTKDQADLAYLDVLLASNKLYKQVDVSEAAAKGKDAAYEGAWSKLDRDKYYIKIDDDVVYVDDQTIPRIVSLKVDNPNYLVVSANVINSPLMSWVHYHTGAMHPYLPEHNAIGRERHVNQTPWRYDDYPTWTGPDDYTFGLKEDPPYDGHRWLRLTEANQIYRTPMASIEYGTWGTALESWSIAAQSHYSFLENLAVNNTESYRLGRPWTTDYERLSINLICLYSNDVLDNLPMDTVDEPWLTVNLPRKLGKSVAVATNALASHMAFRRQAPLLKTDLLLRYRDYAEENVC